MKILVAYLSSYPRQLQVGFFVSLKCIEENTYHYSVFPASGADALGMGGLTLKKACPASSLLPATISSQFPRGVITRRRCWQQQQQLKMHPFVYYSRLLIDCKFTVTFPRLVNQIWLMLVHVIASSIPALLVIFFALLEDRADGFVYNKYGIHALII